MKKNNLTRALSAALLGCLFACLSLSAFAADKPALSSADENSVMGWIAGRDAELRQPFCYRQSYGRGVGVPLSTCSSNQQKNGALCYPECKSGYGGAGPVCWQSCPSGYTDTGAFCHIDKALVTTGHWECTEHFPHWLGGECRWGKVECPSGYTNGGLCYLNTPHDPPGWKGDGLDLIKSSYGRGAGYPMSCKAGLQEDAALCYTPCHDTFHGVGPVCWQNCPSGLSNCGAGCANSTLSCVSDTANMVVAPIILAVNIASLGTASGATTAAKDGENAATLAQKAKALADEYKEVLAAIKLANQVRNVATQTAKTVDMWVTDAVGDFKEMTSADVVSALDQKFKGHPQAELWVKQQYVLQNLHLMLKNDMGDTATNALAAASSFDPTGVSGVVSAYLNPKCSTEDAFPNVRVLY